MRKEPDMSEERKALKDKGDDLKVYAHLLGAQQPVLASTLVFKTGLVKGRVAAALERLKAEGHVWSKAVGDTVYWSWFRVRDGQ